MPGPKGLRKRPMTFYLDPEQYEALRALALATHVSQQWYIREGLARMLREYQAKLPSPDAS